MTSLPLKVAPIPDLHLVTAEQAKLCLRQGTREDRKKLRGGTLMSLLIVPGRRLKPIRCDGQTCPRLRCLGLDCHQERTAVTFAYEVKAHPERKSRDGLGKRRGRD